MKKLVLLAFLSVMTMMTSAYAGIKFKVGDCTDNPDMFLNINGALGESVTIYEIAGFDGFNGGNVQPFDSQISTNGDTQQLSSLYANSACLKQMGVYSVQTGLTAITTSLNNTKTSVFNCTINAPVQPGTVNLNIYWNGAYYACQ